MKARTAITSIALASMVIAGSQAMAFGGGKHGDHRHMGPRMNFEELDANSDGKLSKEEIAAAAKGALAQADTDGDGKITKEEAMAAGGERAGKRFDKMVERFDADKDGALTEDEIKAGRKEARMNKMFDRLDADDDGFISKEEMEDMRGKGHRRPWKK